MPEDTQLSDSDGTLLVKTARRAVTEFLSSGTYAPKPKFSWKQIKLDREFEKKFTV